MVYFSLDSYAKSINFIYVHNKSTALFPDRNGHRSDFVRRDLTFFRAVRVRVLGCNVDRKREILKNSTPDSRVIHHYIGD